MKKKKKSGGGAPPVNLLQLMTISLFIILLAFFILLNSIAVVDDQKKMAVLDSLLGNFGIMVGGESLVRGRGGDMRLPDMDAQSSHVDFSDLLIGADPVVQLIRVSTDVYGTVLSIPAHLIFEDGKTEISPAGYDLLDRLGRSIRKNDFPVEVVGHTDDRPAAGPQAMSDRETASVQATAVLNHWVSRSRIDPQRFTAYGWGALRPVGSNKTKETRAMNRRIDVRFVHEARPEKPKGVFTFKRFFFNVFD